MEDIRKTVLKELQRTDGKLPLRPCWVSRDFLPCGKRLGLKDEEYDVGERGWICERWLASETQAENRIRVENEGLSYLAIEGRDILMKDAVAACRAEILGEQYARTHDCLGRLLKIFDYNKRIFFHIHQRAEDARKVGMNSKEEAYFFLDADPGPHPETFFGVHPYIVRENRQREIFLPYLREWRGEEILKHSRAYLNVPGEGFHLPPGILHAPGTALTLELQESSDVLAVLQAEIEGLAMDKELLYRHVSEEDKRRYGEEAVLRQIDWESCADPYFYENHHLTPRLIEETRQEGAWEEWVWYNTTKFSGTRITIRPGSRFFSKARGVHGLFVWRGKGEVDGCAGEGQKAGLTECRDELLIAHDKALKGCEIKNSGGEDLVLFKFFGPDINTDNIPYIKPYKG